MLVLFCTGKNQYKQFVKLNEFILKKYLDEIKNVFGVDVKDIGVRLLRKRAARYDSSGWTCVPLKLVKNI